jgi:hypothetical protein
MADICEGVATDVADIVVDWAVGPALRDTASTDKECSGKQRYKSKRKGGWEK